MEHRSLEIPERVHAILFRLYCVDKHGSCLMHASRAARRPLGDRYLAVLSARLLCLAGQFQQLRTVIMEAVSNVEGHTLLYIPPDDISNVISALKDKVSANSYLQR